MRTYLAMQEMQSGKGLGGSFFGRPGLLPYGQGGMLLGGEQGGQGKVCESSHYLRISLRTMISNSRQ